jgi:hypothetical protein
LSIILILLTPSPALAYIDPGTGSIIFQGIIAAAAAGAAVMLSYWQRLKNLFRRRGDKNDPHQPPR